MIRNINEMWKVAIGYKQEGMFDTEAMKKIQRNMTPRLPLQDVANVINAVYADDYWNPQLGQMDPGLLEKRLMQGLGLKKPTAEIYADTAMKQWRGILCRKSSAGAGADTGRIPFTGSWTNSIDIICNNDTELDTQTLLEGWNNEFWKTPQVGNNYVYVRCQNKAFIGGLTPQVQMFYAQGGINQPPSSWQQMYTMDKSQEFGDVYLFDGSTDPMEDGVRGASEAFNFNVTSPDHVCLIAAVVSEYFVKNNPVTITGNWNSQRYIQHDGAAVWRNVDPQLSVESVLKIHNQDGRDEKFSFVAQCRNVPVGSKISLSSRDPKIQLDSGDVTITTVSQRIEIETTLPAFYSGDLIVTMQDPGGQLLPAASLVEMSMLWTLHSGHTHYMDGISQLGDTDSALSQKDISIPMGSYTLLGGGN